MLDRLFPRPPLTRSQRDAVTACVAALERASVGEVRVVIQRRRRRTERALPLMELALAHFRRLGMEKTREQTGVLLFVLLAERKLQIVADAGIHARVPQDEWDAIAAQAALLIGTEGLHAGLLRALERIGARLAEHFPRRSDDANELPDAPELR